MRPKKIRILFTISNFNTAGSGKVVYDLVSGLDRTQFDIAIACGSDAGAFFKEVTALGVPIHIFETKTPYKPYYNLLYRVWLISKFYKKHDYDIVHSWQWSSDWTEALAARLAGIKWLYTKKAMGFASKHWHIKSKLADFIVTINDEMSAYFPNKKQQALIPLGIDTAYYSPDAFLKPADADSTKFHIITVANLVPVKGIEVLLRAIQLLDDSSITLTVLGDCDNAYGKRMIALCAQLDVHHQVKFLGKQLDVRPYIAAADLYVIPTLDAGRKEGMPMALVEAMSMGIPVLGSDITGINFVLKNFRSLLFEAGNPDGLALKIGAIKNMGPESRFKLGQDLRAYCQFHFTMDAFISAHDTLYKTLLQDGSF